MYNLGLEDDDIQKYPQIIIFVRDDHLTPGPQHRRYEKVCQATIIVSLGLSTTVLLYKVRINVSSVPKGP